MTIKNWLYIILIFFIFSCSNDEINTENSIGENFGISFLSSDIQQVLGATDVGFGVFVDDENKFSFVPFEYDSDTGYSFSTDNALFFIHKDIYVTNNQGRLVSTSLAKIPSTASIQFWDNLNNPNYVLFTKRQVEAIIDFHAEVIFSGTSFVINSYAVEEEIPYKEYSTLKIEGVNEGEIIHDNPILTGNTGIVCPPHWKENY